MRTFDIFRDGAVALTLLGCLLNAQGQAVYRIVLPDGRVVFSDRPSGTATQATPQNNSAGDSATGASLPYALRQVVERFPVTLYSGTGCAPCDEGRQLLRARGTPFTEKTVTTEEDVASLQSLAQTRNLPLLTIGAQQLKGYSAGQWHQYLDLAGYPRSNALPAGYRNPAPTPLVQLQKPATPAATDTGSPIAEPLTMPDPANRTTPTNPAGIQF